ncbi:MAG: DUF2460 domain-containing protein [Hyphomicrobiales bacterium]|nr:DUF2460 domain-containing protein [Hyphomicrobiales bacterium]
MNAFHEALFPLDIALGARGGPERRTDIVALGSGREQRNARWARSRRKWQAGYGVKTFADLDAIVAFFEERRGRLYGFRFRDPLDHSSAAPGAPISPFDQTIGRGDGAVATFQLTKSYGGSFAPYQRTIAKPAGAARVAVGGVELAADRFTLDPATGRIALAAPAAAGAAVTAGFLFDTPARFDDDHLDIDHSAFGAGEIPRISIVELFL